MRHLLLRARGERAPRLRRRGLGRRNASEIKSILTFLQGMLRTCRDLRGDGVALVPRGVQGQNRILGTLLLSRTRSRCGQCWTVLCRLEYSMCMDAMLFINNHILDFMK